MNSRGLSLEDIGLNRSAQRDGQNANKGGRRGRKGQRGKRSDQTVGEREGQSGQTMDRDGHIGGRSGQRDDRDHYNGRDQNEDRNGERSDRMDNRNQQNNYRWDRDRLSREIWDFFLTNCQTLDLLDRKKRLRAALHKILTTHFPNYDLTLFIVGSTATGLADNKSDVDICLVLNDIDNDKQPLGIGSSPKETSIFEKLKAITKDSEQQNDVKSTVDEICQQTTELDIHCEDSPEESSIDKLNVSTSSLTNGNNDPSIPMLKEIEEVLKAYNFVTKLQIIMAKVPILKFVDRISGIEVTLNVHKLVSIRNTHLIRDYVRLDWRVQPLVLVIKAWAKDHDINDAYNKSISSYSLVLMVVHYLQYACDPPVLPVLQKSDPKRYSMANDVRYLLIDRRPKRWISQNNQSLKELLVGFLDYYSYNYCYSKNAVSVRMGHTLPKHLVQRYQSDDNAFGHWKYLCVEEPFNRTNTARSVYDELTFERIHRVFRVSHYTLRRYPSLRSIMNQSTYY